MFGGGADGQGEDEGAAWGKAQGGDEGGVDVVVDGRGERGAEGCGGEVEGGEEAGDDGGGGEDGVLPEGVEGSQAYEECSCEWVGLFGAAVDEIMVLFLLWCEGGLWCWFFFGGGWSGGRTCAEEGGDYAGDCVGTHCANGLGAAGDYEVETGLE